MEQMDNKVIPFGKPEMNYLVELGEEREELQQRINHWKPDTVDLHGRKFWLDDPAKPFLEALPEPIETTSLQAVVDYLTRNPDQLVLTDVFVHIEAFDRVSVFSRLIGDHQQRRHYLVAKSNVKPFPFNSYITREDFVILLQAKCHEDANLIKTDDCLDCKEAISDKCRECEHADGCVNHKRAVLKYANKLVRQAEVQVADDGVTQNAVQQKGARSKARVDVPSPVTLVPQITFPEIEQPPVQCVLRLKERGEDSYPDLALMRADGGAAEIEAMQRVAAFLRNNLEDTGVQVIA